MIEEKMGSASVDVLWAQSISFLDQKKTGFTWKLRKMMKCFYSGEHLRNEGIPSSESLATRDFSASGYSSRAGDPDPKLDTSNIEEAESSLRESEFLNYEEARALLGRLEYQKGNIEAALHVFEGIDIAAVTSKIKISIARRSELPRRHSQSEAGPPMSMHAVSLLFEAIFLKAKSLQALGQFREAAESCKIILDTVESTLPDGLLNFSPDYKMQDTLNKAVGLLPELWKLAWDPQEMILSYRRALLYHWNLDSETRMNIEKGFAIFLLYSGCDASPPNLRSQTEGSYVPRNNIEEAILLLLILIRKSVLRKVEWDPSIFYHLSFALSIAGELRALAHQVEEFTPGIIGRKERYTTLALSYYGDGEDMVALNLLRNLLNNRENHDDCTFEVLLASKICGENSICLEEGIGHLRKLLLNFTGRCDEMASIANFLLGVSLSSQSRQVASDFQTISRQSEALEVLKTAQRTTKEKNPNPNILFHLSIENAEQRKLDVALYYANQLVKIEAGSSVKGWILLARILSAQKRYMDAENIVNAAIDETGKWDQGELLRTKAKLQIAQGHLNKAIQTYTHLLAVLQVHNKSFGLQKKLLRKTSDNNERSLEMETWHDLANVYTRLSQWRDAEVCLSKSKAINPHSASRWHSAGLLYQAKGQKDEALKSFQQALDVEPNHVPSLISTAVVLRKFSENSPPAAKSFLTDALRIDRTNSSAWYNLGMLYRSDKIGSSTLEEAAECFEAAALLQDTEPIEPFR